MEENYSGVSEAAAPEQASQETMQQEPRHVPLEALEAERAQRQQLQDEVKMMKEHLSLLQARSQPQQQAVPQQSYDDDDVMTFGDFKKVAGQIQSSIQGKLSELEMMQKYPDYQDVVTKYLPEVLKSNPELRQDLESNPNYYRAYYMAKNSDAFRQENQSKSVNPNAEKAIHNTSMSGSLSSVGGASAINHAKRYRDMSDEEFMKEANKNRGYI